VRGLALTDPAVVGMLQPFIMTFWWGHRDDPMPDVIRENAFPRRPGTGRESNVKAMALDAKGNCVEVFDSMPIDKTARGPFQDSVPQNFEEHLGAACKKLGLPTKASKLRALALPGREGEGVSLRMFVRLDDPGMPAYFAPVVEVVSPTAEQWGALAYPREERGVDASVLQACWHELYPPGVMERQDKTTYVQYRIAGAEGTLTLSPAGERTAVLSGRVKLTDEGPDGFSFEGTFEAVLTYAAGSDEASSLKGVFEATYPRHDRAHDRDMHLPLTAAIETVR